MIVTGERKNRLKTCPSASLSTINLTCSGPESNTGHRSQKPAPNCPRHTTVVRLRKEVKLLSCPMIFSFRKGTAFFGRFPRLRPFVLLIREICWWKVILGTGGIWTESTLHTIFCPYLTVNTTLHHLVKSV